MSDRRVRVDGSAGQLGFIFFLCYVGAAVYFVNKASGFGEVLFAFIKAIFWPAYLIFYSLTGLGV